ncbi:MAG: CAP domain-containing protein [Actinomycetota bacterium]
MLRIVLALVSIVASVSAGDVGGTEACIFDNINAARAAAGVASLQRSSDLSSRARAWSERMASEGSLYHSTIRSQYGSSWKLIGENVAEDFDCAEVHRMFMASEHHRDNILDARFTLVGVGAAYTPDGILYVTQAFVQGSGSVPAAATAPAASTPTAAASTPKVTKTQAPATQAPAAPAAPVAPAPTVPEVSPAPVATPKISPFPAAKTKPFPGGWFEPPILAVLGVVSTSLVGGVSWAVKSWVHR